MSFTKTISIFAALASIFGAGAAGWKLAQDDNQQPKIYEERIQQLEEQLKQQSTQTTVPQPVILPPTQSQVQQAPQASQLPSPPPPVPPEQVSQSTP